jgi:hypothetical protein
MGAWWSPVDAYAGNSFWFMRTSGYTPRSVTYVCDFGFIYSKGTLVTCSDAGVLPALWIDLDKAQVPAAGETVSADIMHTPDQDAPVFPVPEITVKAEWSHRFLPSQYNDEPSVSIGVAYMAFFKR